MVLIRRLWIQIRSSLWFVPLLLVVTAIVAAMVLVELDVYFYKQLRAQRWEPLLNAGEDGARGMLSAIASSMITVAGVAFSITIVTLSLASTQYTPRILRNFMRDRANQFVLGIFVAVFTYCLIVLRTIRSPGDEEGTGFVPLLAVAFGMLLALLAIACFIFFIHHIAASIQASTILQAVTNETLSAVQELFPEDLGEGQEDVQATQAVKGKVWHPVLSEANGYLQHIDSERLLQWAEEHESVLRLDRSPGDFVYIGAQLVLADKVLKKEEVAELRALFVTGDFRSVDQDAGFGIRQIVDIALKALSPGVNDTSTAVSCLDYLGAILCQLADRQMASPYRAKKGELRVIAPTPSFPDFLALSFDQIRLSAAGNVTILRQLLHVLARVAAETRNSARREALLTQARLMVDLADSSVSAAYDRASINSETADLRQALAATEADLPVLPPRCVADI